MNKANAVMTLSTLALAIGVSLASQQARAIEVANGEMSNIGYLSTNIPDTYIWDTTSNFSADGNVVVGWSSNEFDDARAFRFDARTGIMQDLGTLRSNNGGQSYAYAVSADGNTVVGRAQSDSGEWRAFRFGEGDARLTDLGTLRSNNSGGAEAMAVSSDGKVIAGYAATDDGAHRAFRYDQATRRMTDLGSLRSNKLGGSMVRAMSKDGGVIVGYAETDSGQNRAYRYQQGRAQMTDLGTFMAGNAGQSEATNVSADGKVVVGQAAYGLGSGETSAFRHSDEEGMVRLGSLRSDNLGASYASAVSDDGRVVVGLAQNDTNVYQAFRHNKGDSQLTPLGNLRSDNAASGSSFARGVSGDGKVVVGEAAIDVAGRSHAFLHREGDARMTDLGTLGTADSRAYKANYDGSVVLGWSGNGGRWDRAFIWRAFKPVEPPVDPVDPVDPPTDPIDTPTDPVDPPTDPVVPLVPPVEPGGEVANQPEPQPEPGSEGSGGVMQDLGYLFDSMPLLAAQTEQAFRAQQRSLGRQLDNACVSGAEGQQCLRVAGELSKVTDAPTELDYQVAPQLSLAYGYGLTDQLTAGVTASMFGSSLDNQLLTERGGAELDSGVGVGSYLHFSQGADETGVQAGVSLGYGEQRGEFVRGDGLANVQHGKGKADVKSVAVRGSLGYGVEVADWKVTPHAEVTHFITSRDGYREGGERLVFDVEHDKVKDKSTVGKVGVKGETALAKGVKLKLDTGVEMDLDVNPVTLKGRSDIFSLGEGMQEFAVSAELERNDMRPYAAVGVGYELEQAGTVGLNVKASQAEYGNQGVDGSVQLSYELKF
ncbi:hypothetical protein H4N55_15255 [Aeromonas veronii]|uniref:hypothetical protein n=1 Tax=Aeromonas TaxID=642 RepID=UPI00188B890F|nr:hypothetical protein [Aeromonas veronii]MBF3237957.1 hypothetical protein [Aeromonas veronii]